MRCYKKKKEAAKGALFGTLITDQAQLEKTLNGLSVIMENLMDYMNDHDAIVGIDVKITNAASDILLFGNDDLENEDYLEDQNN